MALFSDGEGVDAEWLRNYESSLLEDATGEGIEVSRKIALAQQELSGRIEAFLRTQDAGVIEQVVLSDLLRECWSYLALSLLYRDAFSNQLSKRYERAWLTYAERAEKALTLLFEMGIGMVHDPILRPVEPTILMEPADYGPTRLLVQVSFVSRYGQEGSASSPLAIVIEEGKRPVISLSTYPKSVGGWNVYCGPTVLKVARQNEAPLGVDEAWRMPIEGVRVGPNTPGGQAAEFWIARRRILPRG